MNTSVQVTPVVNADQSRAATGGESRWSRLAALHAACAFSLAQPLFVRLSTQTAFLLDSGTTGSRLIVTVLGLFFLPPVVLGTLMAAARPLGRRVESVVYALLVSTLLAMFSLQVARRNLDQEWILNAGLHGWTCVAVGLIGGLSTFRWSGRRWFLRGAVIAAVGSLLFPIQFLCSGAAVTILRPAAAPPELRAGKPIPVVVLVFDEFCGMSLLNEDRQIDAVRYPNFARLARSATWYRNATTVHSRTNYAVPAILTGRLPLPDREMTLAESPQNLFTLLQSAGYTTAAFEPVSRLCPDQDRPLQAVAPALWARIMVHCLSCVYLKALVPVDLDESIPRIPEIWYGLRELSAPDLAKLPRQGVFRDSQDISRQFEHFLKCLPDEPGGRLCFLHAMTPHFPWRVLPDGAEYVSRFDAGGSPLGGGGPLGEDWVIDELPVRTAWQQYLLQVGDVDRRLGIVLDRLEAAGQYDECLLVVTGDHGVSFQPGHSRRVPDGANLSDILSVPLFIKFPGQHVGRISDRNVESIDVLPTIAAAIEIELDSPVDGESLLDEQSPERPRKTLTFDGGNTVADAAFRERFRSLERMLETFGSGTANDGLRAPLGPHAELIGRRIEESQLLPDGGASLILRGTSRSKEFNVTAGACYVEADFLSTADDAMPVSVAIVHDELILGTSRTSRLPGGRMQFNCLLLDLPQPLTRDELDVFIIHESETGPLFEPVDSAVRRGAARSSQPSLFETLRDVDQVGR